MKLRRVRIQNVRSFLESEELLLDGDISILIGPNGGGKTNLLDTITTILRRHLLTSRVYRRVPSDQYPDRIQVTENDMLNHTSLEPHFAGGGLAQEIEVEVEATPTDIANMTKMHQDANRLGDVADRIGSPADIRSAGSWDPEAIRSGDRFVYQVIHNHLQLPATPAAQQFQAYLGLYEADGIIRESNGEARLSTPMLHLPVNRASGGFQSSISLAGHSELDFKKQVDAASSKLPANIVALALGRIAQRHRLLLEKDRGGAMEEFLQDPQMHALTRILGRLGYGWELISVNPLTNQYDIRLSKQGASFLVSSASSGEKELLTYLFGIFALNVRDALIVIDEPELHLHPRWQKTLLTLFETLAEETGNQFLLATHSPVFVSASSIQFVSRVFSENQKSKIVRLNNASLPEPKHLFAIVNSQNNERMFFTEQVILVEGISDRLVFDAVFTKHNIGNGSPSTYEVIDVGGKHFFEAYKHVLNAARVPFVVIADLDFVSQVGTTELKGLFRPHKKRIAEAVTDDLASLDGQALVDALDQAISSEDLTQLRVLWEYIKARRSKLKPELTTEEQHTLREFILSKRSERIYILSAGALETYLPEGCRSKDVGDVIRLVGRSDFWETLPDTSRDELLEITQSIDASFREAR